MAKFNIAYIAYYDLSRNTAATEHISRVVEELAALGNSVRIFLPKYGMKNIATGIDEVTVPAVNAVAFDRLVTNFLDKSRQKIHIIYIRDFMCSSKIVSWAKHKNIPIIIEHNGLYHAEVPFMHTWKSKAMFLYEKVCTLRKRIALADTNIVVAPAIGEFYAAKYGIPREKFVHIPNGVDIERFRPARDRIALREKLGLLPADALWMGYAGSMYPWHMLDKFIEAFELLARERDDIRLFIGGDGDERPRIESLVVNSPAAPKITVKSPLKIAESAEYIAAFDLGVALMNPRVAPYCWQVKVNHNAACAVPSLITECKYFGKLVDSGAVIEISKLNPQEIALELAKVADRSKLYRMGMEARKFAQKELSWKSITNKIEIQIKTVIGRE